MDWKKSRTISSLLVIILTLIYVISFSKRQIYPYWQYSRSNITNDYSSIVTRRNTNKDSLSTSKDNPRNSDVLLIYVYADTHPHAYGNLKYFIENGVRERDGADYYFILQQVHNKPVNETEMPQLPKTNAQYIQHENKCFDFGTVGWFFDTYTSGDPWKKITSITSSDDGKHHQHRRLNLARYKYFILMNSSIRGPYFPPYYFKLLSDYEAELNKTYYWYSIFTRRINSKVKLVGCTISCYTVPHVQSYILTTDFIGLSILLKPDGSGGTTEGIFGCYPTKDHATLYSELPSSNRILEAGYMIDSLLTKYQTIDFSAPPNRRCNTNTNPYKDKNLDGTSLEPYEVVFVKYNDKPFTEDAQRRATLYQRWIEEVKKENKSLW